MKSTRKSMFCCCCSSDKDEGVIEISAPISLLPTLAVGASAYGDPESVLGRSAQHLIHDKLLIGSYRRRVDSTDFQEDRFSLSEELECIPEEVEEVEEVVVVDEVEIEDPEEIRRLMASPHFVAGIKAKEAKELIELMENLLNCGESSLGGSSRQQESTSGSKNKNTQVPLRSNPISQNEEKSPQGFKEELVAAVSLRAKPVKVPPPVAPKPKLAM